MNNSEAHNRLLSACCQYLPLRGWIVHQNANQPTYDAKAGCYRSQGKHKLKGMPDLTAFKDGRTVFVEVKTGKGKLNPDQKVCKTMLEAAGFTVILARSIDDLEGLK